MPVRLWIEQRETRATDPSVGAPGRPSTRIFRCRADSVPGGWRSAETVLRRDGPVCCSSRSCPGYENHQTRYRRGAIQQRDAIQTAELIASIDQVSQGRFLFGFGGGWNQDEMEDHGTVYASRLKRVRESIEAMKEIWTKSETEYHGEFVNFDPMIARPKSV